MHDFVFNWVTIKNAAGEDEEEEEDKEGNGCWPKFKKPRPKTKINYYDNHWYHCIN